MRHNMILVISINSQFLRFVKPFLPLKKATQKNERKISLRDEKSHDKNAINSSKSRAMSPFTFNHFPLRSPVPTRRRSGPALSQ